MDNRSRFCDLFIYLRSECVSASRVRVAPLKACRVRLNGQLRPDVNAKDVVLHFLRLEPVRRGELVGRVFEYTGEAVSNMTTGVACNWRPGEILLSGRRPGRTGTQRSRRNDRGLSANGRPACRTWLRCLHQRRPGRIESGRAGRHQRHQPQFPRPFRPRVVVAGQSLYRASKRSGGLRRFVLET